MSSIGSMRVAILRNCCDLQMKLKSGRRIYPTDRLVTGNHPELENSGGSKQEKQSDVIINLALAQADLFHAPDGTGFADVQVKGHRETWRIGSSQFRLWASRLFYETRRSAPNSDAMQSALKVLKSKACFDGEERAVSVRVAGFEDRLYLDLGTPDWKAAEIDANGWRVIANPPVRFRRAKGMSAPTGAGAWR